MARFTGGWIKLWRSAWECDLSENMYLWALWNWLLFAAHWKPSSIIWEGSRRDIPAGTVVLGIKELADKWECSQSTIKRWLTYLKTSERISLETCPRGTLVTILNWDVYQSQYAGRRDQSVDQVGTEQEQAENNAGLSEEVKKVRREEIYACVEIWEGTLSRMGIQKSGNLDEVEIGKLIIRHGLEKTKLALLGAGFEAKSEKYDPTKHVSIRRLHKPDVFETFVNLGAQHKPAAIASVEWDLSRVGGA